MTQRIPWGLTLCALVVGCDSDPQGGARLAEAGAPPALPQSDAGDDGGAWVRPTSDGGPQVFPGLPAPNTPPSEPVLIDTCSSGSGLDPSLVQQLTGGGGGGSARLVYPYDGTVFPRGIAGPTLMWDGVPGAQAAYLHVTADGFEYRGCQALTGNNQIEVPAPVWEAAGRKTRGPATPFSVALTLASNGSILGPLRQTWTIAQATLKGSIYYNTYASLQGIPGTGKVMRIPPGGQAELYVASECNGCHSVSANGTRLVSATLGFGGRSYDIGAGNPVPLTNPARSAYVALYPDGSRYVLPSMAVEVARSNLVSGIGLAPDAALVDTRTGSTLPSQGIPPGALMPSFSSDGRLLVFNDFALGGASGLALVDFDGTSNVASNYRPIFQDAGGSRPGWPFLLPDNRAVVFTRSLGGDFSGNGAGVGGALTAVLGTPSELYMVDVQRGTSTILARAMGYATPGDAAARNTYLPFGEEDIGKVYFPTVSPVAAGGYFWVFFDAVRHYGNRGLQRQLWGTAVEIAPDGDYTLDRSSPAFYLPGQEFGTGNHRAFTALDACKQDGNQCETGVDCCSGFCTRTSDIGPGVCSTEVRCAKTDERCSGDADCCPPEAGRTKNVCIAGFCAEPLR